MYSMYVNGTCFYDNGLPLPEYAVISPTLTKEVGAAGSLDFTLPPSNICYGDDENRYFEVGKCEIVIKQEDEEIWRGRILTEESDFFAQRHFTVEGDLTYLNDTMVDFSGTNGRTPTKAYSSTGLSTIVHDLLVNHNNKVSLGNPPFDKQFSEGGIYVPTGMSTEVDYIEFGYENTLSALNKLAEMFELYLRTRKVQNGHVIDFIHKSMFTKITSQAIEFGDNLLDFSKNFDSSEIITAVLIKGSEIESESADDLDHYVDISGVDAYTWQSGDADTFKNIVHESGSLYLYNSAGIAATGWNETILELESNDTTTTFTSNKLCIFGSQFLQTSMLNKMQLEVSAVDFSTLGMDVDMLDIYKQVYISSEYHGVEDWVDITSVTINLDEPEKNSYKLGADRDYSLTSVTVRNNNELQKKIESLPSTSSVLDAARQTAGSIIQSATSGKVTITNTGTNTEALVISENNDYAQSRCWVFNVNGLGYWPEGYRSGQTPETAMTMNGEIVADRITTGSLNADRIKGGHLVIGDGDSASSYKHIELSDRDLAGRCQPGYKLDNTSPTGVTPDSNYPLGERVTLFRPYIGMGNGRWAATWASDELELACNDIIVNGITFTTPTPPKDLDGGVWPASNSHRAVHDEVISFHGESTAGTTGTHEFHFMRGLLIDYTFTEDEEEEE